MKRIIPGLFLAFFVSGLHAQSSKHPIKSLCITDQTVTVTDTSLICYGSSEVDLASSQVGVNYYLRNNSGNTVVAGPVQGNGGPISFSTGNLTGTTTFNVYAVKPTGALSFSGANTHVDMHLQISGSYTKEAWIYQTTDNGSNNVVSGIGGTTAFWCPRTINGVPHLAAGHNGNWVDAVDSVEMVLNAWMHIAVTYDVNTGLLSLYKNGNLVASTIEADYGTDSLQVGDFGTGNNFSGSIDEVRIYNRVLSPSEIMASVNNCLIGNEAGLILYYTFEDGTNSPTVSDVTGLNPPGSLVNINPATDWVGGVENCSSCFANMSVMPTITVNPIANQVPTAATSSFCVHGSTTITIPNSQNNVNYSLRNNSNNNLMDGPYLGTGSAITFNTGNLTSTTTFNVYAKAVDPSMALNFNGASFVSIPYNPALTIAHSGITIEAWFNTTATGEQYIITKHESQYYVAANVVTTGRLGFWLNDVSSSWLESNAIINDGNWHHAACTWDGATMTIYIDGVFDISAPCPGRLIRNDAVATEIGARNSGNLWNGQIDEVRIWDTCRTGAQILANMSYCLNGNENHLRAYYKFDDGSPSQVAADYTANHNYGMLMNANVATDWVTPFFGCGSCSAVMSPTVTISIHPNPPVPTITLNGVNLTSSAASGNQWYLNGVIINGATSQTYTPTVNGNYTVVVTDVNGCSSTSNIYVFTITGINNQGGISLMEMYPNPANDQLHVVLSSEDQIDATLEVTDLAGRVLFGKQLVLDNTAHTQDLDISSLPNGMYLLRIYSAKGQSLSRFIKQ